MNTLINDATNELNLRQRGREARLGRLRAAGWPTDRESLRHRLSDEMDAQLESEGGVYHCCTARASSRVNADLPIRKSVGCRITRVPIAARLICDDEDGSALPESDWVWSVQWGRASTGSLYPATLPYSGDSDGGYATAADAEDAVRRQMLATGECVETRTQAVELVKTMLAKRVG